MAAQAARLRRLRAALAAVLALATGGAGATTTEEAYAAANHRRTPFEASGSSIPVEAGAALSRLFALTDQGVVLRIESMKGGVTQPRYEALLASLKAEALPAPIAKARDEIVAALMLHQRVAASGAARAPRAQHARTPEITAASGKLHSAYDLLMRAYPAATARQKQAFYDHLCALDYL